MNAQIDVLHTFSAREGCAGSSSNVRAFRAERLKTPVVQIKVVRGKMSDVGGRSG